MNGKAPNQSAPLLYVVGIAGALLMVVALVWALQRYTLPGPLGQERAAERKKFLAELRQAEAPILTQYSWQDQPKGLVRLPITNAMEIIIREYEDPAAARALLIERIDQATAPPPEVPSEFE